MAIESSLPDYFLRFINEWIRDKYMSFIKILKWGNIRTTWSEIWSWPAKFIFFNETITPWIRPTWNVQMFEEKHKFIFLLTTRPNILLFYIMYILLNFYTKRNRECVRGLSSQSHLLFAAASGKHTYLNTQRT